MRNISYKRVLQIYMQISYESHLSVHSCDFRNLSSVSFFTLLKHIYFRFHVFSNCPFQFVHWIFPCFQDSLILNMFPRVQSLSNKKTPFIFTSTPIFVQKIKSDRIPQIIKNIHFTAEISYVSLAFSICHFPLAPWS